MLTKEHLRLRVSRGRAIPSLLDDGDREATALADEMIAVFAAADGMRLGDLEETLDGLGAHPCLPAFKKLLLDQCGEEPDDGRIEAQRWQWLEAATTLRRERSGMSLDDFQTVLAATLGRPYDAVREELYGDLPACRRVCGFKTTTADALLARYNLAQVQGLLLRARDVEIEVVGASIAEKRTLFRQLKFHRLLSDIAVDGATATIKLGGPLSIFDQAAAYGMRLANFFPHIVHLREWRLSAEVNVKNRSLRLEVDHTAGLKSHYKVREAYIPDELGAFVQDFESRAPGWRVQPGEDFVHIGRESYCFPDFTLDGGAERGRYHVELFHRWHRGQLLGRLAAVSRNPVASLFIGVARALARDGEIAEALAASTWFQKNGFVFSEFPTSRSLLALLAGSERSR